MQQVSRRPNLEKIKADKAWHLFYFGLQVTFNLIDNPDQLLSEDRKRGAYHS